MHCFDHNTSNMQQHQFVAAMYMRFQKHMACDFQDLLDMCMLQKYKGELIPFEMAAHEIFRLHILTDDCQNDITWKDVVDFLIQFNRRTR